MALPKPPTLPIPISLIAGHYLIFSSHDLHFLRTVHAIQGLQTGTLSQLPQQNTFRGLPVELMPGEVGVLLERGVAVVVDELARHEAGVLGGKLERRRRFLKQQSGQDTAIQEGRQRDDGGNGPISILNNDDSTIEESTEAGNDVRSDNPSPKPDPKKLCDLSYTPSQTSAGLLSSVPSTVVPRESLPLTDSAAAFISHLSSSGYTVGPGMQYGAEYVAYPGPPEATHSHLLVKPIDQNEPFSMRDLIAFTRLGNSVQKIYAMGGLVDTPGQDAEKKQELAVFTFEWAGF